MFPPAALAILRCPVCGAAFGQHGGSLRCPAGHTFDVARQGHVNLLPSVGPGAAADTAAMVDARARFLAAGHYAPIADAVAAAAASQRKRARGSFDATAPVVLDVGAGTGYYLAAVLNRSPDAAGLALDLSPYAARRAARSHARAAAVVADVWRPLPVAAGSVDVVVDVFAPRNAAEFRRVLRPGGALVVVTPAPDHLGEIVEPLGLLTVDARKDERLDATLSGDFTVADRQVLRYRPRLSVADVELLVRMGPSAHHLGDDELRPALSALGEYLDVTIAVTVAVHVARA